MTQDKSPTFVQKNLKTGVAQQLTLKHAEPKATGQSTYGEWQLWVVEVHNGVVEERGTKAKIENYTGEAVTFPSKKMIEAFAQITGGTKEGCVINVTKQFGETEDGSPFTEYIVEEVGAAPAVAGAAPVVTQGQTPPNNLTAMQLTFIKDFKGFVDKKIVSSSQDVFTKFGKTAPYNFDDATLVTLWNVYNE